MTQKKSTTTKFQLSNVLLVSLAHLAHDIFGAFLAPILPLLIQKHQIGLGMAGLLSVFQRLPSMFNFVVGMFAEKLKARYFVILGPAITGTVMSLLGVAPTYFTLVVLLLIAGISSALFHVPSPVMIRKLSGERIGLGMSLYMVGGELARTLGPILIIWAVEHWALEGTFKLIPFGIAASVVLYFRLRKTEISSSLKREGSLDVKYWTVFKEFLPVYLGVGGIIFFSSFMKAAFTFYLPTYLTSNGMSLWLSGVSLSVVQFSGVVGTFFAGSLSDKLGRRTTLLATAFAMPLLMGLFLIGGERFVFPILILVGLFLFASGPVFLAVINEFKTPYHSFVNGVYMTLNFVITSGTVVLMGFVSDRIGLELVYKISAVLALFAIPFAFKIPKKSELNRQ